MRYFSYELWGYDLAKEWLYVLVLLERHLFLRIFLVFTQIYNLRTKSNKGASTRNRPVACGPCSARSAQKVFKGNLPTPSSVNCKKPITHDTIYFFWTRTRHFRPAAAGIISDLTIASDKSKRRALCCFRVFNCASNLLERTQKQTNLSLFTILHRRSSNIWLIRNTTC